MQRTVTLLRQSLSQKIFVVPAWVKASHLVLLCLSLLATGAQPALAGLLDDLTDGQHVLLMRHADAPGVGDPAGYRLDQCSTQRNLGEVGRQQSALVGQWLVGQGVSSAKIFSSAWCRCTDTARLLSLGAATVEPSLNSFFDNMSLAKPQTLALQAFVATSLKTAFDSGDASCQYRSVHRASRGCRRYGVGAGQSCGQPSLASSVS